MRVLGICPLPCVVCAVSVCDHTWDGRPLLRELLCVQFLNYIFLEIFSLHIATACDLVILYLALASSLRLPFVISLPLAPFRGVVEFACLFLAMVELMTLA